MDALTIGIALLAAGILLFFRFRKSRSAPPPTSPACGGTCAGCAVAQPKSTKESPCRGDDG